jgi:hypothetical protein
MDDAKLEGVRIIFRNFAGEERQYNAKGKRNFSIVLQPDIAEAMTRDGWNVKTRPPREEDMEPLIHLPVKVNYEGRPPAIYLITSRGRNRLDQDTVAALDYADIENVDIIIHPYEYDVNGSQGVAAYVKTMFVTINEDYLERKYAEIPDVGGNEDSSPPWEVE